jgi:adenylate cyclase
MKEAGNVIVVEYLRAQKIQMSNDPNADVSFAQVERRVPPIPILASAALATATFPLPKFPVEVNQVWTFKSESGDEPTLPVVALQAYGMGFYDNLIDRIRRIDPEAAKDLPDTLHPTGTGALKEVARQLRSVFDRHPGIAVQILEDLDSTAAETRETKVLRSLVGMYAGNDRLFLNFYGPPETIETMPCELFMNRQEVGLNKEPARSPDMTNKVVFVGVSEATEEAQKDALPMVFSEQSGFYMAGVEFAATAFANLLEDSYLRPLSTLELALVILSWGILLSCVGTFLAPALAVFSMACLGSIFIWTALYQFKSSATWVPIAIPLLLQTPVALLSCVAFRYLDARRERRNIREAFRYYLPGRMVDRIAKDVFDLKKSHELIYGVCLFADAAQYTTISEKMEPTEVARLINRYFEAVFQPIKEHGGTVSDIIGDSILAIWVASQPDRVPRLQACHAALDIVGVVNKMNLSMENPLAIRIGLHAGPISVGGIGALEHYEFRAVGDVVNTASRIEGLNKLLSTRMLVSDEVVRNLDGFLTRSVGHFILAGKSKPVRLHELICRADQCSDERLILCRTFSEGMRAYRNRKWEDASIIFGKLVEEFADGPSMFYLELCKSCIAQPPGDVWDGVVKLERK